MGALSPFKPQPRWGYAVNTFIGFLEQFQMYLCVLLFYLKS